MLNKLRYILSHFNRKVGLHFTAKRFKVVLCTIFTRYNYYSNIGTVVYRRLTSPIAETAFE